MESQTLWHGSRLLRNDWIRKQTERKRKPVSMVNCGILQGFRLGRAPGPHGSNCDVIARAMSLCAANLEASIACESRSRVVLALHDAAIPVSTSLLLLIR